MGRPAPTIAYGERWAEVSAARFRLWKTFTGAEGSDGVMPWRLFNVQDDRGETRDQAAQRPDILEELKKAWDRYVADNGVLVPATPPAAKRDPASL